VTNPAEGERLVSLDAFRGMTIAAMILVNNPGSWARVYPPLLHANWHGWTPTDLVFPFFLFIVGVSIAIAIGRRLDAGRPGRAELPRIHRRTGLLFLLGLILSGFPYYVLETLRIPGVLQRIGICYLCGSLLFLFTSRRTQAIVAVGCLLAYWPLMTLVPVPGQGAPDLDHTGTSLAAYVDQQILGRHMWKTDYDPEGLLSTIPAVVTVLLGIAAGRILRGAGAPEHKTLHLFLWGSVLVIAGYAWGWVSPINKALWTSSYVLLTGGQAFCGLALCHWFFDVRGHHEIAHPFVVYGHNAITVFVMSGLLARLFGRLIEWETEGRRVTLQGFLYQDLLASWLPEMDASLAYALLWVGGWYLVLELMHRRGIVIKV
jgi:predicted acyltransferase